MSSLDFYYNENSPPCLIVLLTGEALGLKFNLKPVDSSQTKTTEFIAMNPTGTVPTITDNGLSIWESRAIAGYLVQKYGKNDSLYPKSPKQRAKVDRMLHFDMGMLQVSLGAYVYPVLRGEEKPSAQKFAKIGNNLEILNKFVEGSFFAAGNRMTIADIALAVSVNTIHQLGMALTKYPNVDQWFTRCKHQIVGFERITEGPNKYQKMVMKGKFEGYKTIDINENKN